MNISVLMLFETIHIYSSQTAQPGGDLLIHMLIKYNMLFIFSGLRIWSQTRFEYQVPAVINLSGPQFSFSWNEKKFEIIED